MSEIDNFLSKLEHGQNIFRGEGMDRLGAEIVTLRARVAELEAETASWEALDAEAQIGAREVTSRMQAAEAEAGRLRDKNVYLASLLRSIVRNFVDDEEGDCSFCEREDGEHDEFCLGEEIHDALGSNALAMSPAPKSERNDSA